jgi:hypothetical protein
MLAGCALPAPPDGGPRDEVGPKVLRPSVPMGATSVDAHSLEWTFDEFVVLAGEKNMPIFDRVLETDFNRKATTQLGDLAYQTMFTKNLTGLTFAALHPNAPGEVEVIAGVSLPMLLRAIGYRNNKLEMLIEMALTGGQKGVCRVAAKI